MCVCICLLSSWLWVFVAVCRLSLVVTRKGCPLTSVQAAHCSSFSYRRARTPDLGTQIQLSCGIFETRDQTTGPPGKSPRGVTWHMCHPVGKAGMDEWWGWGHLIRCLLSDRDISLRGKHCSKTEKRRLDIGSPKAPKDPPQDSSQQSRTWKEAGGGHRKDRGNAGVFARSCVQS